MANDSTNIDDIPDSKDALLDEATIQRAESAMESVSKHFSNLIDEEIDVLVKAHAAMKAQGVTRATVDALSQKIHDIKGQGSTLDYPFVTMIAEQLCTLCENLPEPSVLPISLVDAHVEALRGVVRNGIKGNAHPIGNAVVEELRSLVQSTLTNWRNRAAG